MIEKENRRETGGRILKGRSDTQSEVSQEAAKNKPPKEGIGNGLSEPSDDVNDEMRHSEGVDGKQPR